MRSNTRNLLLLALCLAHDTVDAFAPPYVALAVNRCTTTSTLPSQTSLRMVGSRPPDDQDGIGGISGNSGFQPDEEFNLEDRSSSSSSGSVDWDAEWKKVMKEQESGQKVERPGDGYYKSDAEIAAIRAANKATEQISQATSNLPSVPSWNSVQSDWKFWIGVLAALSVGLALISAQSTSMPPTGSEGSYYI